jgi:hypothetical protein
LLETCSTLHQTLTSSEAAQWIPINTRESSESAGDQILQGVGGENTVDCQFVIQPENIPHHLTMVQPSKLNACKHQRCCLSLVDMGILAPQLHRAKQYGFNAV